MGLFDDPTIRERVRDMLCEHLGCDADAVHDDAELASDLGADSLDVQELARDVEDRFAIQISDDDTDGMTRVGDVIRLIEQRAA